MVQLRSYVVGNWVEGRGSHAVLRNPSTEEPLAETSTAGIDFGAAVQYARMVGGTALRELTFAERAELLRAMSRTIHQNRDALIEPAMKNGGNTRGDAKFDIDGASATLMAYAELGTALGQVRVLVDGDGVPLGRSARFFGQHVLAPRHGVALHINAFNFPAWGFAEKAACALLAGMPIITKPATSTALVTHRIIDLIVEAKILPAGALTFICGPLGDLIDHLDGQDVLAFTGSSDTAVKLRGHRRVLERAVRVNVEADSLNAAVICADVERGSPTYDLMIGDVVREITQKAGQKCTATRRIVCPQALLPPLREDLVERLSQVKVGDPSREEVTMGPLATAEQLAAARAGLAKLRSEAESVFGGDGTLAQGAIGSPTGKGYFLGPVLLECAQPAQAAAVHELEVFGPVATLLPYDGEARSAAALVARGGGTLVTSAYGDDRQAVAELALELLPYTGRLLLGSAKLVGQSTSPGLVLPQLVHGGPGRAGGGEELGGLRGLAPYLQRTAIQGDKPIVEQLAPKNVPATA